MKFPLKSFINIIIILYCSITHPQESKSYNPTPKYPFLFKAIIPIDYDAPEWVKKMYSNNPNIFEIEEAYVSFYEINKFEKSLHTQNYKHLIKQVYNNNLFDEDGFIILIDNNQKEVSQFQSKNKPNSLFSANWKPIGPFNTFDFHDSIGIRTSSEQVNVYTLAQSVSNPSILICGTETGAAFKSIDKGENWFPIGDTVFNDSEIQSVEIDPKNEDIMFVGTESRIYRSIDGGFNWTQHLNVTGLRIYEFAINPSNNQIIYAAGNKGLYKSINGGSSWSQVFTDTCWDIKFKTDDAQTIFLLKSNPSLKLTEFYKSIDGGDNFTLKSNGWFIPTPTSSIGGARMGVTNADANRIYVAMLGNVDDYATDVNFIGVYRSDDAGESWALPYDQNNDGKPNNNPGGPYNENHWCFSCSDKNGGNYEQGFYNLAIDVSDADPNKFLLGMLNLFKSENGGTTYTRWGGYACDSCTPYYRHPDHQDILINGSDVFVATDGGIDLYDANFNIIRAINKGINGSDNWGFGQGWNEDIITSGRYHNGNGAYHANYGNGKFISLGGGESSTGYVNLGDNFKVYHSDISAKRIPSNITTLPLYSPIPNLALFPNETYAGRTYQGDMSQIVYDPRYFNHLFLGKDNKLWKSEDGGGSFNLVKAFGTSNNAFVTGIEISRKDPNVIFVAQKVGTVSKLWITENGGNSWNEITLPSTRANLHISLNENNTLFIAYYTSGSNKIFKSKNLGQSWENLTTSTLSSRISRITVQMGTNDGVYLAMNGSNSIYYRNASHTDWQLYNQGLPNNKRFVGILPFYKTGEIRVSGNRGFWKSPLFEDSLPIAQPMVSSKTIDCNRTEVQFDDYSVLNHTGATWSWSFPGASTVSSTSVRNPLVSYTTTGFYDVTLTITDSNGNSSTKTIKNIVEVLPTTCDKVETASLQVLEMHSDSDFIISNELTYGTTSNVTFTGWVKPNGIQSNWAALICLGSNFVFGFAENNEIRFHPNWSTPTGLKANANEWNFVAIRFTATQVTIFVNDKRWSLNGNFNPIELNKIILGKHFDWNNRTYKGQMEEFTLWNRALSDDEIYLSRHLIKENITDVNLIAYYQFNNIQNSGLLYDKKNSNDLTISNSISFPTSTAPVGIGTSQLLTINTSGVYNFNSAKANLNFTDQIPNGKVIVSLLNVLPNEAPETNSTGNEYWILNNYGTNPSFSGLSTASLTVSGNLIGNSPSNFSIYKRSSNDYLQSGWVKATTATSANSNTLTFSGNNLNQSSQWYLGSLAALGIEQEIPKKSISVYPNPIIEGQQLKIEGLDTIFTFTLFDVNGKIIFKKQVSTKVINLDSDVSKGIYFYRIETENKLLNGNLIVN